MDPMRKGIPYPNMPETSPGSKESIESARKKQPECIQSKTKQTVDDLGIYTMSPQNHEKQRIWPSKNQVIYHFKSILIKALKHVGFLGPVVAEFATTPS